MGKKSRIIGTTDGAITKAEDALKRRFPESFRRWLLQNNGTSIEDVTIFPVYDERDPRKTWDSIVRNYESNWLKWIAVLGRSSNSSHLLPFGEFGTGDYFCFDFSSEHNESEREIVLWRHDENSTKPIAKNFDDFVQMLKNGQINY